MIHLHRRHLLSWCAALVAMPCAHAQSDTVKIGLILPMTGQQAQNKLNEMALASPAVAHGSVILRTQSKLYRIAKPAK